MAVTKTVNVETTNARASTTLTDTTPTVPLPDTPQGLMVIGPQVTLHFVEDEWNQANSYDYYDVVQVDGTSYIAVQDVPAGTEITNTEYWAKWNDPNAQLALLQQTVEQFDGRINELETADDNLNELISPLHLKLYEPSNGYLGGNYPAGEESIALSGGTVIHKRPYGSYSDAAGIFVNVGDNLFMDEQICKLPLHILMLVIQWDCLFMVLICLLL